MEAENIAALSVCACAHEDLLSEVEVRIITKITARIYILSSAHYHLSRRAINIRG